MFDVCVYTKHELNRQGGVCMAKNAILRARGNTSVVLQSSHERVHHGANN